MDYSGPIDSAVTISVLLSSPSVFISSGTLSSHISLIAFLLQFSNHSGTEPFVTTTVLV